MAYVLQLMAETGKTISQLVDEIPRYVIVKEKLTCPREIAERAAASVAQAFKCERLDLQDGVRIDWTDSWVSVRASNTEPILRIIAEGPDEAAARARIAQVRKTLPNLAG
jgi:phosphomannomutase